MAFNLDHTQNGDVTFKGAHVAFTGDFIFPIPMQARDYHVLMTDNANFGLDALSDINQELSAKVNTSDLGSAAYLDADNVVLPVLEDNGYGIGVLSENIIPASVTNTQHPAIQFTGGMQYCTAANKGDIITILSTAQTYILTGNNKATDWFPFENEPIKVTSVQTKTGDLTVYASELLSSTFPSCTIEQLLNDVCQNKADSSAVNSLICSNDLSSCLTAANLITAYCIDCAFYPHGVPAYLTSSELTSCTSTLTTTESFDCTLLNYILNSSIENKAGHCSFNFIENGGTLVKVNQDSKLDSCLFGDIAYNTHYTVTSEGDLNSLGAQAGDIAIGTSSEEGKTWILDNCGNWQIIMSGVAGLFFLNSQAPDALGCVTLNSQNLVLDGSFYPTSSKISDVSTCYNYLTIDQPYAPFNSCLYPYITTAEFSNCLSLKSDTVHTHLICEVTDLENCLASYQPSPFVTGAYYSLTTDPSISMNGTMNVVLGEGGSDEGYDYAIIHAAGSGDAQVIEFKTKSNLNNYVGDVVFTQDGLDLVSVDLIAHDYYGQNISYRIEGLFSTFSGTTSIIGEAAVTTFAENIGGCASNPILVPTNNCVQICIDTNFGNFDHALANVTLVHVH